MSGKTLSTGTLSLKFMQNAHRAKQLKEVELDKARVKDEGEWEVAKEVRDAWGLSGTSTQTTQDVSYEPSYLPFLFPSLPEHEPSAVSGTAKPKGRRTFNKKGEDVSIEKLEADPSNQTTPESSKDAGKSGGARFSFKPTSISGTTPSRGPPSKKGTKGSTRMTAQDMIKTFDNDSLQAMDPPSRVAPASPAVFLKPSGVDAPANVSKSTLGNDKDIIPGARSRTKVKRERESASQSLDGEGKKKKKKRKSIDG